MIVTKHGTLKTSEVPQEFTKIVEIPAEEEVLPDIVANEISKKARGKRRHINPVDDAFIIEANEE